MAVAEPTDTASRGRDPVAVVGLGYVGLPLALALAGTGARVVGVDTSARVRESLAAGRPLFVEPGVEEALRALSPEEFAITDRLPDTPPRAVIICVGTAVHADSREPDLRHLRAAAAHVAEHVADDTLVIVRSTVPVGTCREIVLPQLRRRVTDPLLAFCPERIIQGRAMAELASLPQIIGGLDRTSAARAGELLKSVAGDQITVSSLEAAEMIKLICNAHTDLLYGFGNEIALLAAPLGLDADELISAANLRYPRPDLARPGFVGGSCLTKDPYLLLHTAERAGHRPPLVAAAREINEQVPGHVVERVLAALERAGRPAETAKVLVCGIAYKGRPVTDDVRGAASVQVAAALRDRVAVLGGHDFVVGPDRIAELGYRPMELEEGLTDADAVVLLVDHPGYARPENTAHLARMRRPSVVFDMWGLLRTEFGAPTGPQGIEYLRLGRG
ncbi:nucleotide sugar dehydrogenase [Marinitenerispora sediminis]|uniref:Nucleotide sugar dehydrogenase n=1 Tax=Marinitenerispora sediminis TaxID=1931232 RepID=A0A368T815_9ACTN|nr:nucleotide sugar dehydrogenase [Marinitenerispora sediminis]RCV60130.1 nucleotide sugar dehydrogenase [Marinitenerispora sediminis]RCV60375.1 nucleotide sugar dehydrogenase [Marinitenerispora sediminis]